MISTIVCDLDGSLMPASSGLYVSDAVRDALIACQEKGILVILNSARVFQGVLPLAHQIGMDTFGGYVISENGSQVYDVKEKKVVFDYPISKEDTLRFWDICLKYDMVPGFSQKASMVVQDYTIGYAKDRFNCALDYWITYNPKDYLKDRVYKVTYSQTKEKMDAVQEDLIQEVESNCFLKVFRNTMDMADVIRPDVDKKQTLERLLGQLDIDWKAVSVIGDGISDATSIAACGLGVTLESATDACKQVADLIVPSVEDDGCLQWLKDLR